MRWKCLWKLQETILTTDQGDIRPIRCIGIIQNDLHSPILSVCYTSRKPFCTSTSPDTGIWIEWCWATAFSLPLLLRAISHHASYFPTQNTFPLSPTTLSSNLWSRVSWQMAEHGHSTGTGPVWVHARLGFIAGPMLKLTNMSYGLFETVHAGSMQRMKIKIRLLTSSSKSAVGLKLNEFCNQLSSPIYTKSNYALSNLW